MSTQSNSADFNSWSDDKLIDDWVYLLVETYKQGEADEDKHVEQLPPNHRDAYLAWVVWMEVGNGGFGQLFGNRGVRMVEMAHHAFARIGCGMGADCPVCRRTGPVSRRRIGAHPQGNPGLQPTFHRPDARTGRVQGGAIQSVLTTEKASARQSACTSTKPASLAVGAS